MKKVVYFIFISLLAVMSCKKDGSNPVNSNTVPSMPTLSTPKDTASNIAIPAVLTWNESSGAKSYTLQVSASSSFSSFVFNKSDITATSQQIPDLNYLSVYYWRVNASNSVGTSDWTKVWSFTTTGDAPAFVPQLSLPLNGAVEQKFSPVLVWDKVNNANSYTLQISTNSSFTNFVFNTDTLTAITKQITDLSGLTQYYWRVSAMNNFGTMGWSETWSFTTGVTPIPPVLLSPTDGATDISLSPTLTWNGSSGATSYILQVSKNSSFSNFVYNQSGLTNTSQQITGLIKISKYFWRVIAVNSFGKTVESEIWSFTTLGTCVGTPIVTYDGKTYHTVQIGSQCWLKENLDVGVMIQGTENASDNGAIEKYCYDNNSANCTTYGGLYQWNEAMQYVTTEKAKGICPTGWHIPTQAEFQTLAAAVGDDGNKLKREDQGTGSGVGTNTSGFSGLLAGGLDASGGFDGLGGTTTFWSSTEYSATSAYYLYLSINVSGIGLNKGNKEFGFSIRCLKD